MNSARRRAAWCGRIGVMDPLPPLDQPSQMPSPAAATQQPSPAAAAPVVTAPPSIFLPLAGLVLAFVFAPAGFIVSIIALRRISQAAPLARGLAIAGIVFGGFSVGAMIILIALLRSGGGL